MSDKLRIDAARLRYSKAMQAVQAGVATKLAVGLGHDTTPKHLRTGLNAAHVSDGAIIALLIEKGICSEAEFFEMLATKAEFEQATYEAELSAYYGKKVTLV